jgi:hypothetical protein
VVIFKIVSVHLLDKEIGKENLGPVKLWTSVNGMYTGSEILVKGKYSF